MTEKEQQQLINFIDKCKTYPYSTQYDKGQPVINKENIEMIKIFIKGLSQ